MKHTAGHHPVPATPSTAVVASFLTWHGVRCSTRPGDQVLDDLRGLGKDVLGPGADADGLWAEDGSHLGGQLGPVSVELGRGEGLKIMSKGH